MSAFTLNSRPSRADADARDDRHEAVRRAASSAAACRPRRSGCRRGRDRPVGRRPSGAAAPASTRPQPASAPVSPTAAHAGGRQRGDEPRVDRAGQHRRRRRRASRSSVMRRPSTCRFSMPARFERGVDLLAAAVDDDQRRRCAATARQRADDRCRAAAGPRAARRRTSGRAAVAAHSRPVVSSTPEHHVHVLHGLARGALQQVVDHRDEDRRGRTGRRASRCRRNSCARRA